MNEITPEGYVRLQNEVKKVNEQVKSYLIKHQQAKQLGDLRENSEYINIGILLKYLEETRDNLQSLLLSSKVIEGGETGVISFGSFVDLEDSKGNKLTYHIVSDFESSPENGKISINSSVGKSLINKKIGSKINWNASVWRVTAIR